MRNMMRIYAAFILLFSEAWSLPPETNQTTSVNFRPSPTPKFYVNRHSAFNLGADVNLTCSNKTWDETFFVIWTINMMNLNKTCKISFNNDGRNEDLCNDGKSLQNTSSARSYLRIPNFSNDDVGIYTCESVYRGGSDNYMIHVNITVPPKLSAWFVRKDGKMVAVCRAERGKPAAQISWNHTGKTWTDETHEPHGFFTVESYLELPEGMDGKNLSCAISHPYWKEEEKILVTESIEDKTLADNVSWRHILHIFIVVVIGVVLTGILFFALKKLMILRKCQQSDPSPPKGLPKEDVEEVEPYASYVQRVNSIYNSSADLFT